MLFFQVLSVQRNTRARACYRVGLPNCSISRLLVERFQACIPVQFEKNPILFESLAHHPRPIRIACVRALEKKPIETFLIYFSLWLSYRAACKAELFYSFLSLCSLILTLSLFLALYLRVFCYSRNV